MNGRFLLVVAGLLSSCCAGEASEESVIEKIVASAGEAAILPCRFDDSDDPPTVEWSKGLLKNNITFLYRDGCEVHEMKNPVFVHRTNFFMNELKNRNISLRISNLQLADTGKYRCRTIRNNIKKDVVMELFVVAVSEPKLSVVPAADGGLTLQCEASCCHQEPELTFVDADGNGISAEQQKTEVVYQDSGPCFTVTRRLTVQTDTNRITCRAHQPEINQTRSADIYIRADCMKSCTATIAVAVLGVVILIVLVSCAAFVHWRWGISVGSQKVSASRQSSNQADSNVNATTKLQRKIDELESSHRRDEEKISQLTEELNELRARRSPIVIQHDQPTTANNSPNNSPSKPINIPSHKCPDSRSPKRAASTRSCRSSFSRQREDPKPDVPVQQPAPASPTQRGSDDHNGPDLFTKTGAVSPSSPSASTSVSRAASFSGIVPRPSFTRSPRRNTTSSFSTNRFSPLADLPEGEDSQPLIS